MDLLRDRRKEKEQRLAIVETKKVKGGDCHLKHDPVDACGSFRSIRRSVSSLWLLGRVPPALVVMVAMSSSAEGDSSPSGRVRSPTIVGELADRRLSVDRDGDGDADVEVVASKALAIDKDGDGTADVIVVTEVTDAAQLAELRWWQQGDQELETADALEQRHLNRRKPEVRRRAAGGGGWLTRGRARLAHALLLLRSTLPCHCCCAAARAPNSSSRRLLG